MNILKGMVGCEGCNIILGVRIIFPEPVISTCSCKPFTIIRVPLTNQSLMFKFLANVTVVLIFRFSLCGGIFDGDNCSETQSDRAVCLTYVCDLQGMHCSNF